MSLFPHHQRGQEGAHGVQPHPAEPAHSPSYAPKVEHETAQQDALNRGRDPTGAKFDSTGGCPGGSPGRPFDSEAPKREPNAAMGAAAPSPPGGQDHKPGEFEQPNREEPGSKTHGDYAP